MAQAQLQLERGQAVLLWWRECWTIARESQNVVGLDRSKAGRDESNHCYSCNDHRIVMRKILEEEILMGGRGGGNRGENGSVELDRGSGGYLRDSLH